MNMYMSQIVDLGYVSSMWEKPNNSKWVLERVFISTWGRSDFSAMGI